jgi:hypothetical protein
MGSIAVFVGLDYDKESVQVCVMDGDGKVQANRACANDPQTVAKYVTPARLGAWRGPGVLRRHGGLRGAFDRPDGLVGGLGPSGLCASSATESGQDGLFRRSALVGPELVQMLGTLAAGRAVGIPPYVPLRAFVDVVILAECRRRDSNPHGLAATGF